MSAQILALDPGPMRTAWLAWGRTALDFGLDPNEDVRWMLASMTPDLKRDVVLVVEQVCSYGMPVGREVFDTVFWSGRFVEAWGWPYRMLPRLAVKMHLCHSAKANDATIRRALLDRFGPQGTKKQPGMLYGVKADIWSALALAVTASETEVAE